MTDNFTIEGNLVDIHSNQTYGAKITVVDGKIQSIQKQDKTYKEYIIPGFVDAHIHIESSLLIPSEFARMAVIHGTVATVSDPHEIANVCGMEGVRFMIENGKKVPFKFFFGAPSCVPATIFETAGDEITDADIEELFTKDGLLYLSEMMNYPGVIYNDEQVLRKLEVAKKHKKPIDGHAPALRGDDLTTYINHGISTDHESFTFEEGEEKIKKGMKIIIREGSAAKNFEALIPLIKLYPDKIMFCSDDKHPDSLEIGHINQICARAVHAGYNVYDVLRSASLNTINHYQLPVGTLKEGDSADFVVVKNIKDFEVISTYIDGNKVSDKKHTLIESVPEKPINKFFLDYREEFEIELQATSKSIRVINVVENQLITTESIEKAKIVDGKVVSDPQHDILKLVVVNRYSSAPPAIAFVKGMGILTGAIASTVAHDSHNIICVGSDDYSITRAINLLVECKGGLSLVDHKDLLEPMYEYLPLPVAGLMSHHDAFEITEKYKRIDSFAKQLGTNLKAPYMTLSFLALLVIPELKLSDKGLFTAKTFGFTEVFVGE